ncbi:MAG TPA: hypothetical protein VL614_20705 [Acetobacteraceae bacterium]|jgi:hypothetical protein|nr:hypothetical protein [Acetobacteraceae bacterium]
MGLIVGTAGLADRISLGLGRLLRRSDIATGDQCHGCQHSEGRDSSGHGVGPHRCSDRLAQRTLGNKHKPLNSVCLPVKTGARAGDTLKTQRTLSEGQRAYEAKRAAKAGMSLEKWLASKERQQQVEERAKQKAAADAAKPVKKPGLLSRLLERAHKPL